MDKNNSSQQFHTSPTKLFQLIEEKNWKNVVKRCERKPSEASIWIVKEDNNSITWRRLPLHEVGGVDLHYCSFQ